MNKIIMKLAEIHNVSPESIEQEILGAMREAMQSPESEARGFWQRMAPEGKEPSLDILLNTLSQMAPRKIILSFNNLE